MKKKLILLVIFIIALLPIFGFLNLQKSQVAGDKIVSRPEHYWFMLHRKSGAEYLYLGEAGSTKSSKLIKTFQVKTGVLGSSPTPLPSVMGKKYWLVIKKESSAENLDTAPYFLTLNIPSDENWPYGPVPYEECIDSLTGEKTQCDWKLPGYFGLHGTGGHPEKLSKEDPGSLGCIRHSDSDITYLYNLLDPQKEEIRYYISDI